MNTVVRTIIVLLILTNLMSGGSKLINVFLSFNEIHAAASIGILRFIIPIKQGQANRYGAQNSWDNDIASCIAEMAVAKATNQYWHAAPAQYEGSHLDQVKPKIKNDVGEDLEVRTSKTKSLIIRKGDKDESMYLYVAWPQWTKEGASVNIVGGLRAKDAKDDKYLEDFGKKNRPACYAVPREELIPAEDILCLK